MAAAIAAERNLTIIRPFDDYDIMAGQGTVGARAGRPGRRGLDQVLVPVGGGGLAAGVATAIKALLPDTAVIGVEPAAADDTRQSRWPATASPSRRRSRSPTACWPSSPAS